MGSLLDQRHVDLIRAEYLEMPGLKLNAAQVQRLCGIEHALCEAALTQPERVFTGQQPVAEALSQPVVERALVVIARVVLKDMLDVSGIRREESMIRARLHVYEVAVSIRGVEERADRIRAEAGQHAEDRIPTRSGRIHRRTLSLLRATHFTAERTSAASEPRDRSEPAKRRARARVGESEGRSPSDRIRRFQAHHGEEGGMYSYG